MFIYIQFRAEIHKILDEDEENSNYGVERMRLALEQRGTKRSYSTVKRAMARGNLLHDFRRSPDGLAKMRSFMFRCFWTATTEK